MKKLRPGVGVTTGGLGELIDASIKISLNVTDDELDFLAENATDDELDNLLCVVEGNAGFSVRRKAIVIRNKYLEKYRRSPNRKRSRGSGKSATRIKLTASDLESFEKLLDDGGKEQR